VLTICVNEWLAKVKVASRLGRYRRFNICRATIGSVAATCNGRRMHIPILRRVGAVLIVIGLLDVGLMIYCIAHGYKYSSSFNIFAVAAGIFLLYGNLLAASILRGFAIFIIAATLWIPLLLVFLLPWNLLVTMLRVCPGEIISGAAHWAFFLFVLLWIVQELQREPVSAAMAEAGIRQRGILRPVISGMVLVVLIGAGAAIALRGETAQHAMLLARQKTGPGYRIFVHGISFKKDRRGEYSAATVYAWNDKGIWDFPVQWQTR
jgi:hypothetical protein